MDNSENDSRDFEQFNEEKSEGLKQNTQQLLNFLVKDLRISQGSVYATKRAIIHYCQRGLEAGLSLDELMELLFFKPTPMTSIFSKVGYSSRDLDKVLTMVKNLTLEEILNFSDTDKKP
jgi:hypothetical protein